jgi:hypothetical protein
MKTLFMSLAVAGLFGLGAATAQADGPHGHHGHGHHGHGHHGHGHGHFGHSHYGHGHYGHGSPYGYGFYQPYRAPSGFSFYGSFQSFPSGSQFNRSYGSPYHPYYGGYSSWGYPYSSYTNPFRGYSTYSFGW